MSDFGAEARTAEASHVVSACESAWRAIQLQHPDVPDVVVILGTGVERGRLVKLGHWWGGRWMADGQVRGEVLLAGEALHLQPGQVFEVLLHEAAHGLNAARGVKDASRGGRYHNARFKAAAEELGLVVTKMPPYGWAQTDLGSAAHVRYEPEIARLGEAMRIARRLGADARLGETGTEHGQMEGDDETSSGGQSKARPATCGCGRKMRMAPSVLAKGPVLCVLCGQEFATERQPEHRVHVERVASPGNATIDDRFLDRRRAALQAEQRSAEQPPFAPSESEQLRAAGLEHLTELAGSAEGVALIAEVGAWRHAQREGDSRAIVVTSETELARVNDAARALLKLEGALTGDAILVDGRELLIGEVVMVGQHDRATFDIDGRELPSAGVIGTVVDIDVAREVFDVDFAIAGRHRVAARGSAAALIEYGYAERAAYVGAPLTIDLRTLREIDQAPIVELSVAPDLGW